MDWIINITCGLVTGIGLWAFLPRGVVLTRGWLVKDWNGQPLYDTWQLTNDSSIPLHIRSVSMEGITTFDEESGKFLRVEVPAYPDEHFGVKLSFDNETLENGREGRKQPWSGLIVPPGDTLRAVVLNNRSLRIRYRRAGICGIFERRELTIYGGV